MSKLFRTSVKTLRNDLQEVKNAEMRGNAQDEEKIQAITAEMNKDLRECDEIKLLEKACEDAEQERLTVSGSA